MLRMVFAFALFVTHSLLATAQNSNSSASRSTRIDSLKKVLRTAKEDTNKVNTLNALVWEFKFSNPDTSLILIDQAAIVAEKINFKKGLANALRNKGGYNLDKSNYPEALKFYFESLSISETLNDKTGMAKTLGNIGIVYRVQADYPKALDYYSRALKIDEELANKSGIAKHLGNIGIVYWDQADYPKALDYYLRAVKLDEELGNKNAEATILGNIGLVYSNQANHSKALDYYFKALKMAQELGDKNGIARHLGNIGLVYSSQADNPKRSPAEADSLRKQALGYYFRAMKMDEELGNKNGIASDLGNIGVLYKKQAEASVLPVERDSLFNKALSYYFRAMKMAERLGDKSLAAITLGNIGSLYIKTGKFRESEKYLKHSLDLSVEIAALKEVKFAHQHFYELYDTTGRYQLALEHYKKYIIARDSINSDERIKKQTRLEENFKFEKKEAVLKEQQAKDKAVAEEKNRKQNVIIYSVAGGLLLVLVFSVFLFNRFRVTQRQKKIIEEQKLVVEEQKKIVEEKNKDILDSIRYAQRIQSNILPTRKYIDRSLRRLIKN